MSDTTITAEERAQWRAESRHEYAYFSTDGTRLILALDALEQAEARAERAEKELAGADAENSELRDELEDYRGTEKDAPNVLCAIARLVGVYEHCQELGDDMGTMSLDAVRDLLAEKQKAEAESVRLTKMGDWLAEKHIRCAANGEQWYGPTISKELHVPMYPSKNEAIDALVEAARRAVAAGEAK